MTIALHVHAQDGNDANSGTAGSPKKTLSAVETWLTSNPSGTTVRLAGTFRGETMDIPALSNVIIEQWVGQDTAILRGDIEIPGPWTNTVGDEWEYTFSVPPSVVKIFENWETRKNSTGANLGTMSALGLVSGAGALLENEFDYVVGTGVLTVRLIDGDDPNNLEMSYATTTDAPTFTAPNTLTIDGLKFWTYIYVVDNHQAATVGAGIRFLGGADAVIISNCEFRDNGNGHIAFNGTSAVDDITITGCEFFGGTTQGGALNLELSGANASNITLEDFTIYGYPTLDRNGVRNTDAPGGANAEHRILWLVSGAANTITDLVVQDGFVNGHRVSSFIRVENWNAGANPGDNEDFSTYPVRVSNVTVQDCRTIVQQATLGGPVAFQRSYLDGRYQQDVDSKKAFVCAGILGAAGHFYFDSCVLLGNTAGATDSGLVFLSGTSKCFAKNTTFYNATTAADATKDTMVVWATSATERLKCIQCVFSMASAIAIARGNAGALVVAANFNMTDCWYQGYDPAVMTNTAAFNTVAEWQASIDANGIYGTSPGFENPPTKLNPGSTLSSIFTKTKIVVGATATGILGNAYTGRYGPYQSNRAPVSGSGYAAASHFNLVTPKII